MERKEKEQVVQELSEKVTRATGMILVDFTGLDVAGATVLRTKCIDADVEYKVVKNTLAKRAVEEMSFREDLDSILNQPTGIAFGYVDPFTPIKVLSGFAKETKTLQIKGSVVEGCYYGAEQTAELAKIPSKTELIGQVLRCVQGPLAGMAGVCSGILRELVGVIDAIKDKKESEGNN